MNHNVPAFPAVTMTTGYRYLSIYLYNTSQDFSVDHSGGCSLLAPIIALLPAKCEKVGADREG